MPLLGRVECCNVVVSVWGHQRDQIHSSTGRRIRPDPVNKSKPNLNGSQALQYGIIPGVIPPSWPPTIRNEKRVAHLGGEREVSGEVRWPDQSLPGRHANIYTDTQKQLPATVQSRLVLFHHPPYFNHLPWASHCVWTCPNMAGD